MREERDLRVAFYGPADIGLFDVRLGLLVVVMRGVWLVGFI